jgi:hypothetical protein
VRAAVRTGRTPACGKTYQPRESPSRKIDGMAVPSSFLDLSSSTFPLTFIRGPSALMPMMLIRRMLQELGETIHTLQGAHTGLYHQEISVRKSRLGRLLAAERNSKALVPFAARCHALNSHN